MSELGFAVLVVVLGRPALALDLALALGGDQLDPALAIDGHRCLP